jgi:hypothetical protein
MFRTHISLTRVRALLMGLSIVALALTGSAQAYWN